jgi:hypothetical protein
MITNWHLLGGNTIFGISFTVRFVKGESKAYIIKLNAHLFEIMGVFPFKKLRKDEA